MMVDRKYVRHFAIVTLPFEAVAVVAVPQLGVALSALTFNTNPPYSYDIAYPESVCPFTMGILRPATPGFITTLVATILLAVVSFSVPYFKSVYFLEASLAVEGVDGSITFGTLGYCIQIGANSGCSPPAIGYQLGELHIHLRITSSHIVTFRH
jgi:hypothetical protein